MSELVADEAVPFSQFVGDNPASLLPDWYMPTPMSGVGSVRRWRRIVAIIAVVSFVVLNVYGLCSTYGSITIG